MDDFPKFFTSLHSALQIMKLFFFLLFFIFLDTDLESRFGTKIKGPNLNHLIRIRNSAMHGSQAGMVDVLHVGVTFCTYPVPVPKTFFYFKIFV